MVEKHKKEMHFLLRVRELQVSLTKISPALEVALSLLMKQFDHTNK